jgi:glycine cleavage system H protein
VDLSKLKYTPDHLWVNLDDGGHVTIGLTEEGLADFEDLVKLRLPEEGTEVNKDDVFCRISVGTGRGTGLKLLSPLTGEVVAINDDILDAPETILEDPYEEGWLVRMAYSSDQEYDDLMDRTEYDEYLDEGEEEDEDDEDDDDYYDEDEDEDEDEDDDYFDDDDDDDY